MMRRQKTDYGRIVNFALMATVIAVANWTSVQETFAAEPEVITNTIGMNLVAIPAGEFMMGAEENVANTLNKFPYCDPAWLAGELPQHKVRITKSFYLGQYEVTLGEFLKFCNDSNYQIEAERDGKPSWGYENGHLIESNRFRPWDPVAWKIEMNHPAIYLTWNDAVAFCEWLSKAEGQIYRLPTAAEWEYACRAGSNHRYSFGDEPEELFHFANAADKDQQYESEKNGRHPTIAMFEQGRKTDSTIPYPFISHRDGYAWTAPVGKFQPNAFGLYDMHGNAWEWCSDWFDANYFKNSPTDDPQGPTTGVARIARGGGFITTPVGLRCAYRLGDVPSYRCLESGFRVVRVR